MSVHLGDRIEEYVLGRLAGSDQDAAEEHLLACKECFEAAVLLEAAVAVGRGREAELLGPAPAGAKRPPLVLPARFGRAIGDALAAAWQRPAWGALAGALAAGLVVILVRGGPGVGTPGLARLEPYPLAAELLRGIPASASPSRAAGLDSYRAGRYQDAARHLERHLGREPGDGEARFVLAVSLLLAGRPREAVPHLDQLVARGEGNLRDAWYLAQAYLAVGEPDAARPYLRQVAASDWVHAPAAREQLAALPRAGSR
jgi:tetratricopeptide (TPR) repeat protein